jgi:hypothetical protein
MLVMHLCVRGIDVGNVFVCCAGGVDVDQVFVR